MTGHGDRVGRRVAVVTGARQGIGRRLAEVLAAEGYVLALLDVQPADETLAAIRDKAGADALALVVDVASEADVEAAATSVLDRFGHVDVVVNNAAVMLVTAAEATTAEQWRHVLDVNLTGTFLVSRAFGRSMLDRRRGCIVNIASIAGLLGFSDRVAYNSSKHGVIGLTRTLASEWGGRGVRVNAVCPSWVRGESDTEYRANGAYTDEDIIDSIPLARFATAEDVARAVVFLADEGQSGYVNGHTLSIDGGWAADGSWPGLRLSKR
jgi:NAD(P)-dependent dehydrogenase (short-subunit alcohol dehydrogenase family)